MRRRDILFLLGVVPINPLRAAQGRSGKPWRLVIFHPQPTSLDANDAFVQGMRLLGHMEGQDFIIDDVAYDEDNPDEAAREIVQHHVDLILAMGRSDIVLAAKRATRDIPIVFVFADDPVASGIVASMSRARWQCDWAHFAERAG
jgi:putative tryptophan/tyrosine transport system substrate-binding protein